MRRQILAVAAVLGIAASPACLAVERGAALGSGGEIYSVHTGTYGDLFPKGKDVNRDNPVLALDIAKPGTPTQRVLVPGTEGPEVEDSPSVVFEDSSDSIYLLWESEINIHPILQLSSYDGRHWSKTIQVTGNPFALKTSQQFSLTRDAYEEPGPDGASATRHNRTIIHLIWQEGNNASGLLETFYTPIIIKDGVFIGWNPLYNLDDYVREHVVAAPGGTQPSLERAPVIQSGRDERTVLVAYTSTAVERLVTIEIDALPEQLSLLAHKIRSHIIDLGHQLYPTERPALAEKIRSHIIDLGHAFRPEVTQAIAEQTKAKILTDKAEGLEDLAEKIRSHIIDLGAQLSGRGLRGLNGADKTAKIFDLPGGSYDTLEATESDLLQFRLVSNLPVPRVGTGTIRVFLSENGESSVVSWAQPDKVSYRSSRQNDWTEPRELILTGELNLTKAYEILKQRVRSR